MWFALSNGLYETMGSGGNEYNTTWDWASNQLTELEDAQYISQMALVVDRMFVEVHQRWMSGKPFHTVEGEIITVDLLINTYGLVGKLQDVSALFAESAPEVQQDIIATVTDASKSRSDVQAKRDEIKGKRGVIRLPYVTDENGDGTINIFCRSYSKDQTKLFISLLGAAGEQQLSL